MAARPTQAALASRDGPASRRSRGRPARGSACTGLERAFVRAGFAAIRRDVCHRHDACTLGRPAAWNAAGHPELSRASEAIVTTVGSSALER